METSSSEDDRSISSDLTVIDESDYDESIASEAEPLSAPSICALIRNRELCGRLASGPKAMTAKPFVKIPDQCTHQLSDILPLDEPNILHHIFMGFTVCGQFLLSYMSTDSLDCICLVEYNLFVWRFTPGRRLKCISKHRIFRHMKAQGQFLEVSFSQWPNDRNKVVAYGSSSFYQGETFIAILLLPSLQKCSNCNKSITEDDVLGPQCFKHGIVADFLLAKTTPYPEFSPTLMMAFPDHIVVNTGHNIHILNMSHVEPQTAPLFAVPSPARTEDAKSQQYSAHYLNDNLSDISECPSDLDLLAGKPNIVDAIIQDFSEYDFENNECSKPFHELNISCEPLNVIGKSYVGQQQLDGKDVFASPQTSSLETKTGAEKAKIDRNIVEKTYEFTEENEKCEKLSSFRKKRLADKTYEFSEDNCENIVPFNRLRYERIRAQLNRLSRSSDLPGLFLSPRAQTIRSPRSPMLSPSSRNSQFSPGGTTRSHYSARGSPLSPRGDQGRKFNVCSPSHADCEYSDSADSKLVLRQISNIPASKVAGGGGGGGNCPFGGLSQAGGLLIVDAKKSPQRSRPKWIRTVIRRYCSLDFESNSLASDAQNKDEPIELPSLVFTSRNVQLDAVPTKISDEILGPHVKILQRSFDCEQFCHRLSEKLCNEAQLKFTYCEDYDIKVLHVCPFSGDIICAGLIKMGAEKNGAEHDCNVDEKFFANFLFSWSIPSDEYHLLGSSLCKKAVEIDYKLSEVNHKKVRVMIHNCFKSLKCLKDEENSLKIVLDKLDRFCAVIVLNDSDSDSFVL